MRSTRAGPSWRKRKPELPICRLSISSACQTKSDDRVSTSSRASSTFFSKADSRSSGSGFISQAAISSSEAP